MRKAIIISVLALFISGGTLYLTEGKPFTPHLTLGDPFFQFASAGGKERLLFIVPVIFSNEGAKPGCIFDLRADVKLLDLGTTWRFFPTLFINYESYLKGQYSVPPKSGAKGPSNGPEKRSVFAHIQSNFTTLFLTSKKTELRYIVFIPRQSVSRDQIRAGRYQVVVWFWECGESEGEKAGEAFYNLRKDHLTQLNAGRAVAPLNEDREIIRKQ